MTLEQMTRLLALGLVLAGGLAPNLYLPASSWFGQQRWRYRDVMLLCTVFTAITVLPSPDLSEVGHSVMVERALGLFMIVSVWAVIKRRQSHPWRALGFDSGTALMHALWALRIALAIAS